MPIYNDLPADAAKVFGQFRRSHRIIVQKFFREYTHRCSVRSGVDKRIVWRLIFRRERRSMLFPSLLVNQFATMWPFYYDVDVINPRNI